MPANTALNSETGARIRLLASQEPKKARTVWRTRGRGSAELLRQFRYGEGQLGAAFHDLLRVEQRALDSSRIVRKHVEYGATHHALDGSRIHASAGCVPIHHQPDFVGLDAIRLQVIER